MTKQQFIAVFIMMILTSVVVSAATVFGAAWYFKNSPGSELANSPFSFLTDERTSYQGPSFHPLEKLVLSVKGKKQTHFVMLEMAVETRRPDRIENIDNYMPVVRNAVLKLFSQKTYDDLHGADKIEKLQAEVKQTVLDAFARTDVVRDIDDILLTKYVVQ
jgi:flagellar FliL protein